MIMPQLVDAFYSTLPSLTNWINTVLEVSKNQAVPVLSLEFPRLNNLLPNDLLARTKVVLVPGQVPIPSFADMGLPNVGNISNQHLSGVTYKDTFFINESLRYAEGLYFHELVHAIQWEHLGEADFLLTYGATLYQYGYENNPFELMAYKYQNKFDTNSLSPLVVDQIKSETDFLCKAYKPFLSKEM